MLQQLFGTELSSPMRIIIALIVIAALLGITVAIFRRLNGGQGERVSRGRQGLRLAVVDTVAVDQERRLVLVRRDSTEHLLLIGGNSDIVVETQIPAPEEEPVREAVPQQRPPRRVAAAPAPAALAASAALDALAPPAEAAPAPLPAPMAEPEAERSLRRRPLLRGDGTLSGRDRPTPAPRPVAAEPVSGPRFDAAPSIPALPAADTAILPMAPARREPVAPALDEAPAAPVAESQAAPRPSVAEAEGDEAQLDDMARRLDAALTRPASRSADAAVPKLDLADLLGDLAAEAAAPLDDTPAPPEAPAPEPAPAVRPERPQPERRPAAERPVPERPIPERVAPERPAVAPERVAGRPMRGVRPPPQRIAPEPRVPVDPRVRPEPPRAERAPLPGLGAPVRPDPAPRATAGRSEPTMRLREFSMRPADAARAAAPEVAPEPVVRPAPVIELSAPDAPATPQVAAPANDSSPEPVAKGVATPPAKGSDDFNAALDEFDSEMANLLGRTSSRGR